MKCHNAHSNENEHVKTRNEGDTHTISNRKTRVIFFGGESTGLKSLKFLAREELVDLKYCVLDRMGRESKTALKLQSEGKCRICSKQELLELARSRKDTHSIADAIISVFSPFIVPQELLNIVTYGGFNIHPGRLPEYAGKDPVSWSIYNKEATHETTLHRMTELVDGGPVIDAESVIIGENETAYSLMHKCGLASQILIRRLTSSLIGKDRSYLKGNTQDVLKRRYRDDFERIRLERDYNSFETLERIGRAGFFGPGSQRRVVLQVEIGGRVKSLVIAKSIRSDKTEQTFSVASPKGEFIRLKYKEGDIIGYLEE